ncbi:MAG: hydroxymethylglutaryl-CoA reductase [Gammaproteobacteria bacterium]|nr:hydroxymethylglutaryl-CoA reductase [Gammaproteobacteria bacterium]
MKEVAAIPMKSVGPIKIIAAEFNDEVKVPLATYETTLWPSTQRGAKASRLAGGIAVTLLDEGMTRSITLQASSAAQAAAILKIIETADHQALLQQGVSNSSRFAELKSLQGRIIGNLLIVRLTFFTADAAGHNMVTLASEHIQQYLLTTWPELRYVSISGNYCVDKKVSSVNAICGRGRSLIAEVTIPAAICEQVLRTTPQAMVDLHIKKNLIGSIAAGSLHSANAHFANLLLATYLATGQDAANIIEGSQGMTHTEQQRDDLYFSVTLPSIIVGTVGHGKEIAFVERNLAQLGCLSAAAPGANSRRLAIIIAATVLCGELSLMAALTQQGVLMRAHKVFERRG